MIEPALPVEYFRGIRPGLIEAAAMACLDLPVAPYFRGIRPGLIEASALRMKYDQAIRGISGASAPASLKLTAPYLLIRFCSGISGASAPASLKRPAA